MVVQVRAGTERFGTIVSMWWLRDLRYTRVGKLLLILLAGSSVAGIGYVSYTQLGGNSIEEEVTSADAIDIPLTPMRAECESSKDQIASIVSETKRFSDLDLTQSNAFFDVYTAATRSCTFNEFIEFEQTVVFPWSGGGVITRSGYDEEAAS